MIKNLRLIFLFFSFFFLVSCGSNNNNKAPVLTANSSFSTTYQVKTTAPNFLNAILAVDDLDGVIQIKQEHIISNNVNMDVVGDYRIIFEVADKNGNKSSLTVTIQIVDTTGPVINGLQNRELNKDSAEPNWLEGVTATDNYDGSIPLTLSNVDTSQVNMNSLGSFTVTYTVKDANNNQTVQSITITIVESNGPTIHGLQDLQYVVGSPIPDFLNGITATDKNGNNIPLSQENVDVSQVNMNTVGSFIVTYTVTDSFNTTTVRSITVTIYDDVYPIITLNGEENVFISIGSQYEELGATALDNYDGDITHLIIISGEVDTSILGDYVISYSVKDSNLNETVVTRTIHVIDNQETTDYGNSSGVATDVSLDTSKQGMIESDHDEDWLTFTVTENTILNIYSEYQSFTIYDELLNEYDSPLFIPGKYYIQVYGYMNDTYEIFIRECIPYNLMLNTNVMGEIGYFNEQNYYEINLTTSDVITVYTTGNLDTYGYLYDENFNLISSSDDYIDNNFSITANLEAGKYYLMVMEYHYDMTGSYQLFINTNSDGNDFFSDAIEMTLDTPVSSQFDYINDTDYYKITLLETTSIFIHVNCTEFSEGTLYDSQFEEIHYTDYDEVNDIESLGFIITLEPGTYYFSIHNNDSIIDYQLAIDLFLNQLPTYEDLVINSNIQREITIDNNKHYYRITIDQPMTLILYSNSNFDLVGTLYNWNMNDLSWDDDSSIGDNSTDFYISYYAEPGVYYLLVEGYDPDVDFGIYQLYCVAHLDQDAAPEVAIPLSVNSDYNGVTDYVGDIDWYTFTIDTKMTLIITSTDLSEMNAYLYDENLTEIAYSDNDYFGLSDLRIQETLEPGTYYIRMSNSFNTGSYSLSLLGYNDTNDEVEIALNSTISASLDYFTDFDTYFFTLNEASNVEIYSTSTIEMFGYLFDSEDNMLMYSYYDPFLDTNDFRMNTYLEAGTYYIHVTHNAYDIGDYSLTLNTNDDLNESFIEAVEIPLNGSVNGHMNYFADTDYFTFTLTNAMTVYICTDSQLYLEGVLFDDNLNEIYYSNYNELYYDDNNIGFAVYLEPGTYYVSIASNNEIGAYTILLDENFPQLPGAIEVAPNTISENITLEEQLFKIVVPAHSTLVLYTTGDANTEGTLYDEALNELAYSDYDDYLNNDNFRIIYKLEAGIYYLNVYQYEPLSSYSLHVELYSMFESISILPNSVTENISTKDEWFKIVLPTTATLEIFTTNGDTGGILYDANYVEIAFSDYDDYTGTDNFRMIETLEPGTYYLYVIQTEPLSAYNLHVKSYEEPFENLNITMNQIIDAKLDYLGDRDYYILTIYEAQNVYIYADSTSAYLDSYLYDNVGNFVYYCGYNELNVGYQKMGYEIYLQPGTYQLTIAGWDDYFVGDYVLYVMDSYQLPGATVISPNSVTSNISSEEQWFTFEITENTVIQLYSTGADNIFANLYDEAFNDIAFSNNDGYTYTYNFRIIKDVAPGTYYLYVYDYDELNSYDLYFELTVDGNDQLKDSETITMNSNINSQLDYFGDRDWYTFTLNEGKTVYIYGESDIDLVNCLYASTNTLKYSDYNELNYGDAVFGYEIYLNPGIYYLSIDAYYEEMSTYTLYLSDYSPGLPELTLIQPNSVINNLNRQEQWFTFTITESDTVEIYTTKADTEGVLYDENMYEITYSFYDIIADNDNFRICETLEPGTYYLQVYQYEPLTSYDLYIKTHNDNNDLKLEAQNLNLNSDISSQINFAGDVDWYKFVINETKTVTIYAESAIYLETTLYDANDNNYYYSDFDELYGTYAFAFELTLDPGTYYLEVSCYNEQGDYTLYLSEN